MAAVRLPVLQPSMMERPRTLADCRGGPRPCAYLSCKFNLLTDVLEDGNLVLNYPSKRTTGAERTIPDKHDVQHAWYVEVRLPAKVGKPQIFGLGPLDSAPRAREVARAWEAEHGKHTAKVHRQLPENYQRVGPQREGAIDAKFNDEADDAVEFWFDEPDPNLRSCLIDEVDKLSVAENPDEEYLLEQISEFMYVSRERVRQVEGAALEKFGAGLRAAGFSINDLLERD